MLGLSVAGEGGGGGVGGAGEEVDAVAVSDVRYDQEMLREA